MTQPDLPALAREIETVKQLARDIGTVSTVLERTPEAKDYKEQRRTLNDWRERLLHIADGLTIIEAALRDALESIK
jgi:hypothetical protein